MGCWNGTCGISNLPILAGDKVKLFVLVESRHGEVNGNGFCYPYENWQPISLPIAGKYDDYGCIQNLKKDKYNNLLFNFLISDQFEIKKDQFDTSQITNLQDMLKIIGQSGLSIKNDIKPIKVGFMMVLNDVYNNLVSDFISTSRVTFSGSNYNYLYKSYKEIMSLKIKNIYNELKDISSESKNSVDDKVKNISRQMFLLRKFRLAEIAFHSFERMNDTPFSLNEYAINGVKWETKKVQNEVSNLVDFLLFQRAMGSLRKSWMPQCGAGSQADSTKMYKILNNAMSKIISKRERDSESFDEPTELTPDMLAHNERVSKELLVSEIIA